MPAFTFEKISPEKLSPSRAESVSPAAGESRRGVIVRFLQRLTSAKPAAPESEARKVERLKHKYRKQRR